VAFKYRGCAKSKLSLDSMVVINEPYELGM